MEADTKRARRPRIVVVECHVALGESLCHVLEAAGYDAAYLTEPTREQIRALRDRPPEVLVVGLEATGLRDRLDLIATVAEVGVPTVALTGNVDDQVRRRLSRRAGASWIVGRDESLDRFVEVVTLAAEGIVPDPPDDLLSSDGSADYASSVERDRVEALDVWMERLLQLSPRERAVLEHLSRGRTVDEIAKLDHVAVSTVRTQIRDLLAKLDVSSQLAAVAVLHWVHETGLPTEDG